MRLAFNLVHVHARLPTAGCLICTCWHASFCIPAVAMSYASLLSLVPGILLQAELCLRSLKVLLMLSTS